RISDRSVQLSYCGAIRMRTAFISLLSALLIAVLVWASIIIFAPRMNLDTAYSLIVGSFLGSVVLTALLLTLRDRHR
ncbi:hypothetical protein, partial [Massilia timonae]|uniref:hypothetical protein n=1 Tax=Massilia timonae TaxID=47229 RepID=UPI002357BED8